MLGIRTWGSRRRRRIRLAALRDANSIRSLRRVKRMNLTINLSKKQIKCAWDSNLSKKQIKCAWDSNLGPQDRSIRSDANSIISRRLVKKVQVASFVFATKRAEP